MFGLIIKYDDIKHLYGIYALMLDNSEVNILMHVGKGSYVGNNLCAVKAVMIMLDVSYDKAYNLLAESGRKNFKTFNDDVSINKVLTAHGYKYKRINKKDRCSILEFLAHNNNLYKSGLIAVETEDHIFAIKDGIIFDNTVPPSYDNGEDMMGRISLMLSQDEANMVKGYYYKPTN